MNSEEKVTGKRYRVLKDLASNTWQRLSFWTHAKDVEFEDEHGNTRTLEETCGNIYGITSDVSPASSSDNFAVSTQGIINWAPFRFAIAEDGTYGYYKKVDGADTFRPFNSGGSCKTGTFTTSATEYVPIPCGFKPKMIIISSIAAHGASKGSELFTYIEGTGTSYYGVFYNTNSLLQVMPPNTIQEKLTLADESFGYKSASVSSGKTAYYICIG